MVNSSVKFNIGGVVYQVSRSLLESFPDSMLARIASENWQEDPESEIFIDRDGRRFAFVLDYLRDGSVVLPVTETKESVMKEMKYFGIDIDANKMTETRIKGLHGLFKELGRKKIELDEFKKSLEQSQNALDLVHFCVEKFVSDRVHDKNTFEFKVNLGSYDQNKYDFIRSICTCSNKSDIIRQANDLLICTGLRISNVEHTGNYIFSARGGFFEPYETSKNL